MMRMTRDEQIAAVVASPVPICPCCEHGMDPHGVDPGGICGVGGCECLLTPSAIHWLLNRAQEVGGTVETWEQYEAMPLGSVVVAGLPYALPVTATERAGRREWVAVASETLSDRHMAGTPCTILRVGWSL